MNTKDADNKAAALKNCPYLFINEPFYKDFLIPIEKSKTNILSEFNITKVIPDFNCGEFKFFINSNIEIKFIKNSMNDFWKFLEFVTLTYEPLFFKLFYNKFETFIYIEHINKKNLRLVILNTFDIEKENYEGKIFKYSYSKSKIILDIKVKKKDFIRIFYEKLTKMFKDYEIIAAFEPPIINFDYWVKNSEILEDFLY